MENQFEKQIRMAAIKKGLSLGEVAELVGMSQSNFSKKLTKNNFNETDMRKSSRIIRDGTCR